MKFFPLLNLLRLTTAQIGAHRIIFALCFTAAVSAPAALFDMPLAGAGALLAGAGSLLSGWAALRLAQTQVKEREDEMDRREEEERWSHLDNE